MSPRRQTADEPEVEPVAATEPEPAPEPVEPEVVTEPDPAPEVEPVEPEPSVDDPEPEPTPEPASVTFVCDQWAGVRLHGTQIKFEQHRFTTSDEQEIARLDAWEHARREG